MRRISAFTSDDSRLNRQLSQFEQNVVDEFDVVRSDTEAWAVSTLERPTTGIVIGQHIYDTTLGKPIWLHSLVPIVWHDATGAAV